MIKILICKYNLLTVKDVVTAFGHPNITATHRTTFEVTKDEHLSLRGDCIIGVRADKSVRELDDRIRNLLKLGYRVKIEVQLPQYGLKDEIIAFGSPMLTLKHPRDIVVRRSDFVCDRTLAIKASKAARDIKREIVELLRDPNTELRLVIKKF